MNRGGQVTLGFLGPVVTLEKPTFCDQHQAKVWASRVEIKLEDKDHNKQKLKQVEKKKTPCDPDGNNYLKTGGR